MMGKDRREKEIKKALAHRPGANRTTEALRETGYEPDAGFVSRLPTERERRLDNLRKAWYRFSRNKLSVVGLVIVALVFASAIFAEQIIPFPEHAGAFTDFTNAKAAPGVRHIFGTDEVGRDIFSRVIFAFRNAMFISMLVLSIAVPVGVFLGLLAGYKRGTWLEPVIMRITDVFLAVPALLLALAIAAVLKPSLTNSMLAITVMWWPWYTRLVYNMTRSCRNETYVIVADLIGAKSPHIIFKEILPNCYSPIFTKIALDVGWVIMMDAALSFVGMGIQPPAPSLGQMVSRGMSYLPECWWMTVFPAFAIIVIILGFNFLGDGIRDMLSKGVGKND